MNLGLLGAKRERYPLCYATPENLLSFIWDKCCCHLKLFLRPMEPKKRPCIEWRHLQGSGWLERKFFRAKFSGQVRLSFAKEASVSGRTIRSNGSAGIFKMAALAEFGCKSFSRGKKMRQSAVSLIGPGVELSTL